MKLNRTRNTKRNIVFGMINRIFTLLFPFIIRTVLIRHLGLEYAGLNSLFTSILQVLSLSELGFSSAVVYSMYKPIAENDKGTVCALLNFYKKVYFVIGTVIFCLGILLLPVLPNLIKDGYPADISLYKLYLIYLVNTCISYWFFGYKNSLLNVHQRLDLISNISSIVKGGLCITQITMLIVTRNYYAYILMMPIFTIVTNILTAIISKRNYPEYQCKGVLSPSIKNDIKIKVAGLLVNKLCLTTRNTFDSIFISAFLGLTATAQYGNYYTLMHALIGLIAVITSSMLAGIGNSIQTDTKEKNYNDFKKFNFLYMWICGWCTVCLLCLYQPFMFVWMGEESLFPYSTVILFCVYFFMLKIGDIRAVYSDAAGLWWENRHRAIMEAVANFVLNFIFVRFMGINGIILATLISLFSLNFVGGSQIVFKHYFKNNKLKEYFLSQGKYAICTAVAAGTTFFACSFINIGRYWDIILKGVVCMILPNVIYFMIYRKSNEFQSSMSWIFNHMPIKLSNRVKTQKSI